MRNATRYIWLIVTALCLLTSCAYQSQEHNNKWTLTQSQRDSIAFSAYHHYNVGYNFLCTADSMLLSSHPEGTDLKLDYPQENVYLYEDDDFVVTEIFRNPNVNSHSLDSIWLCVGSDGIPLGWISEQDLHHNATPVDPISRFMAFGYRHHSQIEIISACLFILFIIVASYVTDVKNFEVFSTYYILFNFALFSAGAVLGAIKCLVPEMWEEFYYHPSLNPVGQPPLLALYLSLAWLSIIFYIAIFFDLKEKMSIGKTLLALAINASLGAVLYLVLSRSLPKLYIICIFYVLFIAAFAWGYFKSKKKCKQESQ